MFEIWTTRSYVLQNFFSGTARRRHRQTIIALETVLFGKSIWYGKSGKRHI